MVAANAVSLTVCYCIFVSATVSHNNNYSAHAIQTINSDDVVGAASTKPRRQMQRSRDVRLLVMTSSPQYLRTSVFKDQFPWAVARIRSFHVNN